MEQLPDHYAALGISPEADQDVIAAAYRALLKKYHPDTGTARGTASKERLAEVLDAFEVLGDPRSRAEYDAARARLLPPVGEHDEARLPELAGPAEPRGPILGPPGERAAEASPSRRAASWIWVFLPVLLAGSGLGWYLTGQGSETPPQPAAVTVAPEPKSGNDAPAPAPEDIAPPLPPLEPALPEPAAQPSSVAQPAPEKAEGAAPEAAPETTTPEIPAPPPPAQPTPQPRPQAQPPSQPQRPSAFILVIGESGGAGTTTAMADGKLIFNSRASCESFAARALKRRRDAAAVQTGSVADLWFECRPVRR